MFSRIVHNALGMYATWVTIETLINIGIVLTYENAIGLDQHIASSVSLSVLAFEIFVFFHVDNILLEK